MFWQIQVAAQIAAMALALDSQHSIPRSTATPIRAPVRAHFTKNGDAEQQLAGAQAAP